MTKPTTADLREQVRAPVLTAGDPGYDEARTVHNGMFDKHPGAQPPGQGSGIPVPAPAAAWNPVSRRPSIRFRVRPREPPASAA